MDSTLPPGFIAFHSNRLESLTDIMLTFMQRQALLPLEEDIILVQSNGMAEWVKMELANKLGVCAAIRVELPSRFLWRTYRQVLGAERVPQNCPLDKLPMTWLLMDLLPTLLADPDFAPVAGFLKHQPSVQVDADRLLQLASQLADLFDQYQIYRADWLNAWAQGGDNLILQTGKIQPLTAEQRWQPKLWRALLGQLTALQMETIRPTLHQRVRDHLLSGKPLAGKVARRVMALGMSQLPSSSLEILTALANHSQVMLAVANPCRHYWADIMDGRECFNRQRRRHPFRNATDLSAIPLAEMHAYAHPLLAAWGRQHRDFIRQLDAFDDAEKSRRQFNVELIDLFADEQDETQLSLLERVQQRIRDLVPIGEIKSAPLATDDRSIVFHSAHTPLRELEILQDQLLALLAENQAEAVINPRDIIVMVPDIEQFAPAIRAVFGQYPRHDKRFIPFDIADRSAQSSSPLIGAFDWLLGFPARRVQMSELIDLLELPAISARFGLNVESLPKLTQWMAGAGIRWGLDGEHRADLGLAGCGGQNTVLFGLQRMLMGFALGAEGGEQLAEDDIAPFAEIGGLEAELVGGLAFFVDALQAWFNTANQKLTPKDWVVQFRSLLEKMIRAETVEDTQLISALDAGFQAWLAACEQASFNTEIPLSVASGAVSAAINLPNIKQKFRAGGVTFCTLMPMRAIPFKVVCLLGMNEGDFPRQMVRDDFDLMGLSGAYRPGDRSRREDDRQMMLEALLSARHTLYVSWCGRSARDNSEQPPSVLVSQLRDYLSREWGEAAVDNRTTHHPLQPFSRRYFEQDSTLFTYAREWRSAHLQGDSSATSVTNFPVFISDSASYITLTQLERFLKNPVKTFFRDRLLVNFYQDELQDFDDECFFVDSLAHYGQLNSLLKVSELDASRIDISLTNLKKSGVLPFKGLGELKYVELKSELTTMLAASQQFQAEYPHPAERGLLKIEHEGLLLQDWLTDLRQSASGELAWCDMTASKLLDNKKVRSHKMLGVWLRSLAMTAMGVSAEGRLIGQDGVIKISNMDQENARIEAESTLKALLEIWREGMNSPLPLPLKTALASLDSNKKAYDAYEGGDRQKGEVDEAALARQFPDFEALAADGRFELLAPKVYGPLQAWIADHVTIETSGEAA